MKEIKRGEVYYSDLNPILGSEQGGVRPVVILQNDAGNRYSPTTIVAAITSITKKHRLPTHVFVDCDFLDKESIVLLEQIRTVDKKRLTDYLGKFDEEMLLKIDRAIVVSFGIKYLEGLQNE